uniref:RRM domain-containing protein n=1 Tax=Anopheles epiroticus TaxID=199890 RepID=A0A182PGL1_9DIPT
MVMAEARVLLKQESGKVISKLHAGKFYFPVMNPNEVVYISNIPKQTSLAELHSFLKSSGNVVGSTFMRENRNDCRTKIAFVLFENEEQAMEACNLDQTLFQSHRLSVLLSNDDRKFLAGYTIVIQNTSSDTSEEALFEACCRYGNVETVQIPTNYYAFVGFSERSAAHAAQRKLDGSMLKGQQVAVKVLDEDVRVRLEDLDSYKTPRVYNELLRAKQQYFENQQPSRSNVQNNFMDQEDQFQDQQYYDNADDDSMGQFQNESNDYDEPMEQQHQQQHDCFEEEYSPMLIYRRDVRFGKLRFKTANKTAVKVENIPRDVYDEDVVIFFQKFGPIVSIERGICLNAVFTKVYMITYQDEQSQQRAINCFCRQVVLSDITCTIFTMIPGEALHPVKNQSVLINYVPNYVLFDEIVQAFSDVGNVLYVEKMVRNNGPTIVHFTHQISMNDACQINCIAGYTVFVMPVSQKDFQRFVSSCASLRKAAKGRVKGTPKFDYLLEIEAKEEQEKMDNIIFKTGHDPHYRNPNPKKYSFEVVLYNCPKNTKLGQLKSYFNRAGEVLAMRHEPSRYDPDTWKVYVSFANYLEAYRAIRLKGKLCGDLIFKHIAAESPKLDCMEGIMVKVIAGMKDVLKQNGFKKGVGASGHSDGDDDGKHQRPRVLLSDIFAEKEVNRENPAQKMATPKPEPLVVEIKNKPCDPPKASTSSSTPAPPPPPPKQDSKSEDLRKVIAEKRNNKSDGRDKLTDLEEMERFIKQKEEDIRRRLQQLERDEANVSALLPSTCSKRNKSPEAKVKELSSSSSSSRAEPSTSRRKRSPSVKRISPVRVDSASTSQRISTHTTAISSIPTTYQFAQQMRSVSPSDRLAHERFMQIRVEKIAITQELDSLRQRFDYRKGSRVNALRDLLAGLNREQKEIQIQLEAKWHFRMPENTNYKGSSFDVSPSPPSRRRSRSRSPRRSPYRSPHRSPYRSPHRSPYRSRSFSRSPRNYGRSRSRSRSRRRLTRSRSRSAARWPPKSLSPSPFSRQKRRHSKSSSRERARSPSQPRRGYSLERDMYNIGRYNPRHQKHTVYVGNISYKMSERELEEIFARYGRLEDVDFSRRDRFGEAYFNYSNREHAFKALEMNNVKILGRRLRVSFNSEKPCNREGYSLYYTLKRTTDEQTIYRSFEPYGEIDFIWYPEKSLFGTISFRRPETAKEALAVNELDDGTLIRTKPFIDKMRQVQ